MTGYVQDADGLDPFASIADGDDGDAVKRTEPSEWRAEVARLYTGHPTRSTSRALIGAVRRFGLETRGWHGADATLALGKPRKLWAALSRGPLRPAWRPSK